MPAVPCVVRIVESAVPPLSARHTRETNYDRTNEKRLRRIRLPRTLELLEAHILDITPRPDPGAGNPSVVEQYVGMAHLSYDVGVEPLDIFDLAEICLKCFSVDLGTSGPQFPC